MLIFGDLVYVLKKLFVLKTSLWGWNWLYTYNTTQSHSLLLLWGQNRTSQRDCLKITSSRRIVRIFPKYCSNSSAMQKSAYPNKRYVNRNKILVEIDFEKNTFSTYPRANLLDHSIARKFENQFMCSLDFLIFLSKNRVCLLVRSLKEVTKFNFKKRCLIDLESADCQLIDYCDFKTFIILT